MLAVAAHAPIEGSKISLEFKPVKRKLVFALAPPTASTFPLGRRVAAKKVLAVPIEPAEVQVPAEGL